MNKEYIEGFMAAASRAGLTQKQATELLFKKANSDAGGLPPEADPAAALAGAGGPPPGGPGGDPSGGIPPELEQLLSTPEGIQMLLQLVQQMEQGGAGNPHGGPQDTGIEPGGMAPPQEDPAQMMPKGASFEITSDYAEGFLKAAIDYGFTEGQAVDLFKNAMKKQEAVKAPNAVKMKLVGKKDAVTM